MQPSRSVVAAPSLLVLSVLLLLSTGCLAPGYDEEADLLHEPKIVFEPKIGVFVPTDSEFDAGLAAGMKTSYEYVHNAYLSLDLWYASVEGSDSGFPGGFDIPTMTGGTTVPQDIRDIDSEALSRADRLSAVISLDWDIPLSKNPYVPLIRVGFGPGILWVKTNINSSLRGEFNVPAPSNPNPPFDAQTDDIVTLVLRPNLGIRLPLGESVQLFGEAYYDYAMSDVAIDLSGDNVHSDDIDLSGFTFAGGISIRF